MTESDRKTARFLRAALNAAKYEKGISYQEVAARLGVSPANISHWAAGRHSIPNDRLFELAVVLGFDPIEARPELAKFREIWRSDSTEPDALTEAVQYLDEESKTHVLAIVRAILDGKGKAAK